VKLERKPYRLGSPDRDRALGTKSSLNAAGN
jgi:hypothetical protein